jgi:RNA polymerase sigma-70 factor (ECF subfamily)
VAATFSGRALAAQPALVDDGVGIVWAPGGRPKVVWEFTIRHGVVVAIEMIAAPDHLERLHLVVLEG